MHTRRHARCAHGAACRPFAGHPRLRHARAAERPPKKGKTLAEIEEEEGGPVKESLVGMAQVSLVGGDHRNEGGGGGGWRPTQPVCSIPHPPGRQDHAFTTCDMNATGQAC